MKRQFKVYRQELQCEWKQHIFAGVRYKRDAFANREFITS